MIKSIYRLFGIAVEEAPEEPKSEYAGFSVEHYPETNRYYPVYNGCYLQQNTYTGIMQLKEPFLFAYADFGRTEDEAWELIDKYREQRLKVNVRVITR